jgi:hypothetical protein
MPKQIRKNKRKPNSDKRGDLRFKKKNKQPKIRTKLVTTSN